MIKKNRNLKFEGNLYDKIFKENAEEIFIPLVEQRLGIKIKHFKQYKEKMQTTIEREMDFFYKVETEDGEIFILHLEFQTEDELDFVYRVGEYHGIALRKKKMKIRHIVVYLGTGKPKMRTELKPEEVYTGFDLININELDSQELLTSQLPNVALLAILANYPKEQSESILRLLVKQLKAISKTKTEFRKHIKQLVILSRLRKIEDLTIKITEEMPITYDIENDYLYKKGREETIEKKNYSFVVSLCEDKEILYTNQKIASLVGVSVEYVEKIRKGLAKQK